MGQNSSDICPSTALLSLWIFSVAEDVMGNSFDNNSVLSSAPPTAADSPLSAALDFARFPCALRDGEVSFFDVFPAVHLLLETRDLLFFLFFSRGLYSQMSFSESLFCDIWSSSERNVEGVTSKHRLLHKNEAFVTFLLRSKSNI